MELKNYGTLRKLNKEMTIHYKYSDKHNDVAYTSSVDFCCDRARNKFYRNVDNDNVFVLEDGALTQSGRIPHAFCKYCGAPINRIVLDREDGVTEIRESGAVNVIDDDKFEKLTAPTQS